MAGNTTSNSSPVIRAQVYSEILMESINDQFLPEGLHRDVSDFPNGTTLNIPTVGEMPIYDIEEEKDIPLASLDTGSVTLTINRYKGVGGYVTDVLKEDAYKWQEIESRIPASALRGIKEAYETDMLSVANGGQTSANPNTFNGVDHRWVAGATNNVVTLEDIAYMKWAFDKANMPEEGRIAIVDPVWEMTLNTLTNLVNVSNNPMFGGMVTEGFAKNRRFLVNIYGWDIWLSNRLPSVTSETINGGPQASSTAFSGTGVANIFMNVADDMTKPLMGAWRRKPVVTGERIEGQGKDVFYTTARWGFGVQREESLGVIITSKTKYK